jgi:hypothetical protein
MKKFIVTSLLLHVFSHSQAQQTTGLFQYDAQAEDGYVLWSPLMAGHNIYLMNNCGEVVHTWNSPHTAPANSLYLLEDGTLLYPAKADSAQNHPIDGGGAGERIRKVDWEGTVLWDYIYYDGEKRLHHDIEPMPNGNVLAIAWVLMDSAACVAAGRDPEKISSSVLWSERIIEVEPTGPNSGNIVWEWDLWDHLVQDFDPTKNNYGVVAEHPELLDINWLNTFIADSSRNDFVHLNSVAYNAELDQIVLSSQVHSEIWIIDHSTTTEEAAGHSGGTYGKGGDFLYRYGNPQVYDRGSAADQMLWRQHDAHWIPEGLSDAGGIMIFNNGLDRPTSFSEIDVIAPPVSEQGVYALADGEAYGPSNKVWNYRADDLTSFFSYFISGARRLPSGNTMICSGQTGRLFEVTYDGDIVWEYVSPAVQWSILGSSDPVPVTPGGFPENVVFRAEKFPADHPAFTGRDLSGGQQLEADPVITNCIVGMEEESIDAGPLSIYPNPTDGMVTISATAGAQMRIIDMTGRTIMVSTMSSDLMYIDLSAQPKGIYLMRIDHENGNSAHRLIVQ